MTLLFLVLFFFFSFPSCFVIPFASTTKFCDRLGAKKKEREWANYISSWIVSVEQVASNEELQSNEREEEKARRFEHTTSSCTRNYNHMNTSSFKFAILFASSFHTRHNNIFIFLKESFESNHNKNNERNFFFRERERERHCMMSLGMRWWWRWCELTLFVLPVSFLPCIRFQNSCFHFKLTYTLHYIVEI